jgi:hypothetical protein
LLDLQAFEDAGRIRLIEAENQMGLPYCTLSYSWGLGPKYLMTSLNLRDLELEIYVSNLPKTFRDAIAVSRDIGCRYLWIDALCIMQDGGTSSLADADWRDQAGKMSDIFGKSIVTIAASEAHDCGQGFIVQRNPLSYTICRLDVDTKRPFEIIPPCTPNCPWHPFDNAQYHLDTRSWVLQERLLSSRTIHFTRNFVHLECKTDLKCESMSEIRNCHHHGSRTKADYENFYALLPALEMEGMRDFAGEAFLGNWHQLTRKYSTTNLSRASDLLIALAGLAKPLREQYHLTWSFGLCRNFLLREMLWYVRGGVGVRFPERAPTWAWASIDVCGPQIIYDLALSFTVVATITAIPQETEFTRRGNYSANDARHHVKVAGPFRLGIPTLMTNRWNGASSTSLSMENMSSVHPQCRGLPWHRECPFHPDFDIGQVGIPLYGLLVARCSQNSPFAATDVSQRWDTEIGLVLTPVAGLSGRYRRVGYFHHRVQQETDDPNHQPIPSFFNDSDCEVQEVEII